MSRHRSPKLRIINHVFILREEEVPKGDRVVVEIIFLEEEEEEEREGVMHVERQDACLGNAPREIKKQLKLTFWKHRSYVEAKGIEYGRYLMMKKFLLKPYQRLKIQYRGTICSGQLARLKREYAR
jgi:hypothetical protein